LEFIALDQSTIRKVIDSVLSRCEMIHRLKVEMELNSIEAIKMQSGLGAAFVGDQQKVTNGRASLCIEGLSSSGRCG